MLCVKSQGEYEAESCLQFGVCFVLSLTFDFRLSTWTSRPITFSSHLNLDTSTQLPSSDVGKCQLYFKVLENAIPLMWC